MMRERKGKRKKEIKNNIIIVNKTTDCEGKKEKIKIFFLYPYMNIPKFLNIGCLLRKKRAKKAQILEITKGAIIIIISAMIIHVFFNTNIAYRLSFRTVLVNIYSALSYM